MLFKSCSPGVKDADLREQVVRALVQFLPSTDLIRRQLSNSQWWPPEVMRRHQLSLLIPLLEHSYRTVSWYRSRLANVRTEQEITRHWHSLPLLTRSEIQSAGDQLHSVKPPAWHGRISPKWTGGATGSPVMVLRTDNLGKNWIASTLRTVEWLGLDVSEKLCVIRYLPAAQASPPDGKAMESWGLATKGSLLTGPSSVLNVLSTSHQQLEWLIREQPTYLQCYPSVVRELALLSIRESFSLAKLRRVLTFGEVLEDSTREICRVAWGVEMFDAYSAHEVGNIAGECGSGAGYHIHAEHLLVEILDHNGDECRAGQVGRVVITDLQNYAMPLIRYEIGDYAEVGGQCSCGRNLPMLRRILGRQRNMFVLPNGEKLWPAFEADAMSAFEKRLPIRQFQVVQKSHQLVEVRLVADSPLSTEEETAIRVIVTQRIGRDIEVQLLYVDSISRSPTGKFEDFRSDISEGVVAGSSSTAVDEPDAR